MMRVMALEFRKISFWKYLLGVTISLVAILFFLISPVYMLDEIKILYPTPKDFLDASGVFLRLTFTIVLGVMIANVITKEYETGTILNLFLYPIPKKTILISKLALIISLGFLMMLASHLFVGGVITYLNNSAQLVPGIIDLSQFIGYMISSVLLMIATIASSMVSLLVGMKMKSSVATIVASVVISIVVNGQIGTTERISSNLLLFGGFTLVGLVIVFLSVVNVDKEDI